MIIEKTILPDESFYPLDNFLPNGADYEGVLFFDIETTGLSWRNSVVYLIGLISFTGGQWELTQYFAETMAEEPDVLISFCRAASLKSCFIQYNGQRFDIPYVQHKCTQYKIPNPFENKEQLDLYQLFLPLKKLLKLKDFKQKDVEEFLKYPRKDTLSGRELIKKYQNYQQTPDTALLHLIFLHNHDDMMGMVSLLPLQAYQQLSKGEYTVLNAELIESDLLITLQLFVPLPRQISYHKEGYYLTGQQTTVKLKVPVIQGVLKLHYPDYRNYYYLPLEDTSIHKSIGSYVDKSYRIQADPDHCYTKINCSQAFLGNIEHINLYTKNLIAWLL